MNKRLTTLCSFALTSLAIAATAASLSFRENGFGFLTRKTTAEQGPIGTIDSVSFYKNSAVKAAYCGDGPVGTGATSDYQVNKSFDMSGGNWVVSAGAYGNDNVAHLGAAGEHETLFFSSIWDTAVRDTFSIYDTTLENGTFGEYKDDFQAIAAQYNALVFKMAIMSTTTYTNIKDFGFFFHYAAHNETRPSIGVLPLYKIQGETTWQRVYSDGLGWANGRIVYSDANVVDGNATVQTDLIDYTQYTRYYDGAYIFNETPYVGISTDKPVQFAFLVFGDWTNYLIDVQIDGMIINRHESAMKFLNSFNDKTICESGTITDENILKSFELFDRAFESASQTVGVTDTALLENYSIDHSEYPNLREANYYAQYQYLHSKLA